MKLEALRLSKSLPMRNVLSGVKRLGSAVLARGTLLRKMFWIWKILTSFRAFLAASQDDSAVETTLRRCLAVRGPISSEVGRWKNDRFIPLYLLHRSFSTGFTSIHGERPSAEYAKLRKESLESEFGHALGTYSSKNVSMFLRFGPFLAFYRAAIISFHVLKLAVWQFFVHDMKKRSVKGDIGWKLILIMSYDHWPLTTILKGLGQDMTQAEFERVPLDFLCSLMWLLSRALCEVFPFVLPFFPRFIPPSAASMLLGQALSTRPDILPTVYCQELAKLQDQIPPFPTRVAIKSIESQLGVPVSKLFADISPEPIAAASLGQVYKAKCFLLCFKFSAHLHSGELVAVKVQRPGMALSLTLDALLFHMIGGQLKRFAEARKDLLVAVNEMVRHMFEEIDYVLEGHNAERFASIYACYSTGDTVTYNKANGIKVPKIYWNLTRKAVLTMEWIDGIKLTDEFRLKEAFLDRKKLIDQGMYCSLRQLLEVGFFHADPHPGNLVATADGSLAYFDFGMMGDIPRHYRVGLIQVYDFGLVPLVTSCYSLHMFHEKVLWLVHFVNRDSLGLANDFLSLGFIPEGVDIKAVSDALQSSFGDGSRQSRDFQAIMNQLYNVMYEFNFSLPPDYALVIRALGSLEGTAKALDPDFKVVESAYPFVIGRLLADPTPDMRRILMELIIRSDGSIRWNRLERLIAAIAEQASESASEATKPEDKSSNPLGWKSFDMRAVVSATEDVFQFILSDKGLRVRIFLARDIIKAADIFLQDEVVEWIFNDKAQSRDTSEPEGHAMLMRVVNGLKSFRHAINLAPEMWTAMLIRMALKPEVHKFAFDIISALVIHSTHKVPEALWICISRVLHKVVENCSNVD
ncbi:hypothetical protein RHGRI_020880 [Rhododendron griersonianum]|uniref:ABC1 atypical kinase-like domain-containing protein n=1 Tax=Rhododendron griersonianum TaxID=479676 RepID=A0AAV6JLC9_9ERIC|nr:hypothetical protein RHGRI_020880 [Rhododendron griersonianum]